MGLPVIPTHTPTGLVRTTMWAITELTCLPWGQPARSCQHGVTQLPAHKGSPHPTPPPQHSPSPRPPGGSGDCEDCLSVTLEGPLSSPPLAVLVAPGHSGEEVCVKGNPLHTPGTVRPPASQEDGPADFCLYGMCRSPVFVLNTCLLQLTAPSLKSC